MNNDTVSELSDRLITLPDGRAGLRGTLQVEVREADPLTPDTRPSAPVLDFVSSDESLDRYGEIIVASGWRLENYRRNPVFQNAHQYGDVIFTLGRALITEIRGGTSSTSPHNSKATSPHLFQRIEFATEVNPMARIAYGLYKEKFLNAVSVGFIPIRWKDGSPKSSSASGSSSSSLAAPKSDEGGSSIPAASSNPEPIRNTQHAIRSDHDALSRSRGSQTPRRIYLEQELLEVSAVGIPANPNALAFGLKSGAIEKSALRELQDLLRQTLEQAKPEAEWEPVPIKVNRPDQMAELLRLAKEVRELLRS